MTNWQEIEKDAPDCAARVRARFAMGTNKTIATLRKDGSPRISASELQFDDGEVTLGMMGGWSCSTCAATLASPYTTRPSNRPGTMRTDGRETRNSPAPPHRSTHQPTTLTKAPGSLNSTSPKSC
ncbi:pyridoxamine 5'-phosphate oxidase [Micromonospora sp. NBC_00898]|uniref:pyridoxamine 5'-phosphate oxidase n=1 Tax=Micromonospora sp. NBC_00898 TaxID=2975981 RepID=UPI00386D087A|nr:pyridoxamine 5'-phosphate oxidase [Micromonospora sp. NBC_00898]